MLNYNWDNPAYILQLFRQGIGSWKALCQHFGVEPTRLATIGSMLLHTIERLEAAGLVKCDPSAEDWFPYGPTSEMSIEMTPHLSELQNALQFSLADLASTNPHNRLTVTPLFSAYEKEKYARDIFVLMPFAAELSPVYEDHLKRVAAHLKMTIARADDFFTHHEIMNEIWSAISAARLVIADCTTRNPNVFYEIGLAHALGKTVILITQQSEDIPFDLRHRRYVTYELTPRGMKAFEKSIRRTIEEVTAGEV